jgi:hypothetical protein
MPTLWLAASVVVLIPPVRPWFDAYAVWLRSLVHGIVGNLAQTIADFDRINLK